MKEIIPLKIRTVRSTTGLHAKPGISVFRSGIDFDSLDTERFSLMMAGRVSDDLFGVRTRASLLTGHGGKHTDYIDSGESQMTMRKGRELRAVMHGSVKGYFGAMVDSVCEQEITDGQFDLPSQIELHKGDLIAVSPGGEIIVSRFEVLDDEFLGLSYKT